MFWTNVTLLTICKNRFVLSVSPFAGNDYVNCHLLMEWIIIWKLRNAVSLYKITLQIIIMFIVSNAGRTWEATWEDRQGITPYIRCRSCCCNFYAAMLLRNGRTFWNRRTQTVCTPVSYTHLDVYKRQHTERLRFFQVNTRYLPV